MDHRDIDRVVCVLVRQGYEDLAKEVCLLSENARLSNSLKVDAEVKLHVTSQDRDNRRRRMDIAMAVLDESNTLIDLEAIADIIWLPRGHVQDKPDSFGDIPVSVTPVYSDPTQIPTMPKSGDSFVSWDCASMGHRWGVNGDSVDTKKCIACGDVRVLGSATSKIRCDARRVGRVCDLPKSHSGNHIDGVELWS